MPSRLGLARVVRTLAPALQCPTVSRTLYPINVGGRDRQFRQFHLTIQPRAELGLYKMKFCPVTSTRPRRAIALPRTLARRHWP